MQDTSPLKTYFDELEETNGDEECIEWLNKAFDLKIELARFVAARRGGGEATDYVGFLKGSFNISFRFRFNDEGPDAIIRFPKPGQTATDLRDEKVINEMEVLNYLAKETTIPLPKVYSWGTTTESPEQLGPFIIMDYVEGVLLSSILKQPTESDEGDVLLKTNIDSAVLDKIYHQIADYLLQLSRLTFTRIGAISKEPASDHWSVTARPLTYNMNELVTVAGYPRSHLPASAFDQSKEYFEYLAKEHKTHLQVQRNLAEDPKVARDRFTARRRFGQLISKYCPADDAGSFTLYCDDLRPSNMLVDPETLEITAVFDFEFTNAMPSQFSQDPPWWLLLTGPERWLDQGSVEEFIALYEPRLEQFLKALEQVEKKSKPQEERPTEAPLSARMRDSWTTKRFWFDYAARKSFDIDTVYWAVLHDGKVNDTSLDEDTRVELETLVKQKMEQLKAYQEECTARFS